MRHFDKNSEEFSRKCRARRNYKVMMGGFGGRFFCGGWCKGIRSRSKIGIRFLLGVKFWVEQGLG